MGAIPIEAGSHSRGAFGPEAELPNCRLSESPESAGDREALLLAGHPAGCPAHCRGLLDGGNCAC
jgi:hypothetical protein